MKTTQIWHIIDDKFVHLVQEETGNQITYYTNGINEGTRIVNEDGTIQKEK